MEERQMERQIERAAFSMLEVSQQLGISQRTTWTLVHDGQLPSLKVGRRILIPAAGLAAYLERSIKAAESNNQKGGER
jgi:excisionase family DNA binding protein